MSLLKTFYFTAILLFSALVMLMDVNPWLSLGIVGFAVAVAVVILRRIRNSRRPIVFDGGK